MNASLSSTKGCIQGNLHRGNMEFNLLNTFLSVHPDLSLLMTVADMGLKVDIPGYTLLETDVEIASNYFGRLPGTVSALGYAQEYLHQQRVSRQRIPPVLQTAVNLPIRPARAVIQSRLTSLRGQGLFQTEREQYTELRKLLGPDRFASVEHILIVARQILLTPKE
jgi:hypothetical protein